MLSQLRFPATAMAVLLGVQMVAAAPAARPAVMEVVTETTSTTAYVDGPTITVQGAADNGAVETQIVTQQAQAQAQQNEYSGGQEGAHGGENHENPGTVVFYTTFTEPAVVPTPTVQQQDNQQETTQAAATTAIAVPSTVSQPSAGHEAADGDASYQGEQLEADALNAHNYYRTKYHANALNWNRTLADYASQNTAQCINEHTPNGWAGENIAAGYANATAAVDSWGNEDEKYNFQSGAFSKYTGHFTQMVWEETTQVGCSAKYCEKIVQNQYDGWYLVCEYWPRGNMAGEYQENVKSEKRDGGSSFWWWW